MREIITTISSRSRENGPPGTAGILPARARERPAPAVARAGRPCHSGQDARATSRGMAIPAMMMHGRDARPLEFLHFRRRKLTCDAADLPPAGRRGHLPLPCSTFFSSGRPSVQGGPELHVEKSTANPKRIVPGYNCLGFFPTEKASPSLSPTAK